MGFCLEDPTLRGSYESLCTPAHLPLGPVGLSHLLFVPCATSHENSDFFPHKDPCAGFLFCLGIHLAMFRGYSCFCVQESPLTVLGGPYGMLDIDPGRPCARQTALPAVVLILDSMGAVFILSGVLLAVLRGPEESPLESLACHTIG